MKIYYDAGPGDVAGTFHHWESGVDDPNQIAKTYSSQFFAACKKVGFDAHVRSTNPRRERIERDWITIDQRPISQIQLPKVGYHLSMVAEAAAINSTIRKTGCDVALLGTDPYSWMHASLLGRVSVFTSLHNTIDGDFVDYPLTRAQKALMSLTGRLFISRIDAIMAVSPLALRQALGYADTRDVPGVVFMPTYDREQFGRIPAPDHRQRPFRILFAGRIEEEKGAWDLVETAAIMRERLGDAADFVFDIAGDGGALPEMKRRVEVGDLDRWFRFFGYCQRNQLAQLFGESHVFIVPTRPSFREGVCKALVEACIAGRPAVASRATVSYEYFPESVKVVHPGRPDQYAEALIAYVTSQDTYERARMACTERREPFFDPARSYQAILTTIMEAYRDGRPVEASLAEIPSVPFVDENRPESAEIGKSSFEIGSREPTPEG